MQRYCFKNEGLGISSLESRMYNKVCCVYSMHAELWVTLAAWKFPWQAKWGIWPFFSSAALCVCFSNHWWSRYRDVEVTEVKTHENKEDVKLSIIRTWGGKKEVWFFCCCFFIFFMTEIWKCVDMFQRNSAFQSRRIPLSVWLEYLECFLSRPIKWMHIFKCGIVLLELQVSLLLSTPLVAHHGINSAMYKRKSSACPKLGGKGKGVRLLCRYSY